MLVAREALGQGGAVMGTVRIGAPDGLGGAVPAPRPGRIRSAHLEPRLELVPMPQALSRSTREADLAVMVGRLESGRLVARHLADDGLGLYASRAYPTQAGTPQDAADLRADPVLGQVDDLVPVPALRRAAPRRGADAEPDAGPCRAWAVGQLDAVRSGAGIGVLHDLMAAGGPALVRALPKFRRDEPTGWRVTRPCAARVGWTPRPRPCPRWWASRGRPSRPSRPAP